MGPLFGRGNVLVFGGARVPKVVQASTNAKSADQML